MSDKNDTPTGGSNANDPRGNGDNKRPMEFLRRLLGGKPGTAPPAPTLVRPAMEERLAASTLTTSEGSASASAPTPVRPLLTGTRTPPMPPATRAAKVVSCS
ncbi:MAG: hypothetical protein U1U88_002044 [Lawsonella clevelandensis]